MKYTLKQAQKNFEQMLNDACNGQEVLIQHGKVTVRLEPIRTPPRKKRVPGRFAGQGSYSADFFDPLTDEEMKDLGFE